MKIILNRIFVPLAIVFFAACDNQVKEPIDYVNPFIGTGGHGHTYPGATYPLGAVQLSPDTRRGNWDACSGYHYSDKKIAGFSHTHLSGTGCIDLGDILVRPLTGCDSLSFSHKDEIASPGYYSVNFPSDSVFVELTATPHIGVHRYTFSKKGQVGLFLDLNHLLDNETILEQDLKQTAVNEIVGMRRTSGWVGDQPIYFAAQFSKPFTKTAIHNKKQDATLRFDNNDGEPLVVKVSLSLISVENARENIRKETSSFDFDEICSQTKQKWNEELSTIKVDGGTEKQKEIFYTALYHLRIVPNLVSDVNGDYLTYNKRELNSQRKRYSTFSLWDTFRGWNPLMTLVDTTLVNDMINSMLDMYDASGELPIWPLAGGETETMIGYHSVSVIADAYMKGIRGFDAQKALEAMVISAEANKKGADYYIKYGFIPSNIKRESVSCLLEFAYDDWCIAQMAKELGDIDIYNIFTQRAANYINVFDGSTSFFRGKSLDGNWETPFDPSESGRAYTEATAYQYRFFAPHDVNGLIQLYGGKEKFISSLDELFVKENNSKENLTIDISGLIGQYAHGNEPGHHMAHLYSYVGQPYKTQAMVNRIMNEMYDNTPEGICGNEDCGQMSAWYILNALGFYPVCPGTNEFILTTPLFENADLKLANGKHLIVSKNSKSQKDIYISNVLLNDSIITAPYITYSQIMNGGNLLFEVSDKPSKDWGVLHVPYSMTNGNVVSRPYTTKDLYLFEDSISVDMGCATDGSSIFFTLDGNEPTEESQLYTAPLVVENNCNIKFRAYKKGYTPSSIVNINAVKAVNKKADKKKLIKNGVKYNYYEGYFTQTSDLLKSNPKTTGVDSIVSISNSLQEDHFGYIFSGYIYAPENGVYEFFTRSDDGSVLIIGNDMVVNNDGSHAAISASGKIALEKGFHSYRLIYFEDYEGEALQWGWKIPGSNDFEDIPSENLFID
ncbi:MAG: GH92 family glycosyl hydrolase [Bacteroidales bacterium]|nr:GH92 family glycosyl hydrolase [Bacteroidales bacterium]